MGETHWRDRTLGRLRRRQEPQTTPTAAPEPIAGEDAETQGPRDSAPAERWDDALPVPEPRQGRLEDETLIDGTTPRAPTG